MTSDLDRGIAQRLRDRDKSAWNAVCSEYSRDLFGFVLRLVAFEQSTAGDIVQEVWLESLNRIARYDPERAEFRVWLFEIARRRVALFWRRKAAAPDHEGLHEDLPMDPQLLPTEILDRLDRSAIVRAALLAMSPERCRVLTAKYLEDQTVSEIAAKEGKSIKAVESLLTRSRDELRGLLGAHFYSIKSHEAAFRCSGSVHPSAPEVHS
ncbi:MAG: sigma-70 family RNA polymerase sigma factor [Planctomyces sp.]|nr:sigma-70 family RNA polymerase sigma factor [Planctomyces sp.]